MSKTIRAATSFDALSCLEVDDVQAQDIMRYGVISTEESAPVCEAVNLLVSKRISGLPVTHEGQLVGVLSEKDLLLLFYENDYLPGTVSEYMTRDVEYFDIEDTLRDISHYLVEKPFRRVPIVQDRTIAGMITRADLIKYYRQHVQTARPLAGTMQSKEGVAAEIMQYGLLTVMSETPLAEAMDLIVKHQVTGLPVVDAENRLQGIITEKDLLRFICHPRPIEGEVKDLMTTDVISFSPRDSIDKICGCLISNSFYRVPIVDQGQLKGVISRADVLKYRCSFLKR